MRILFFFGLLLAFHANLFAQTDSTWRGEVTGAVRDTTNDIDLVSATVSVYRAADSTLLRFQLTNNFGEFRFDKLPTLDSLRIVVSFVGYQSIEISFRIGTTSSLLNLKSIHLTRGGEQLQEVFVYARPPVRMNGDTLEFFPDAFSLQKNAVMEDLLTTLPGVILWGDGKITVNGRKVSEVLVNGRSFFGSNQAVALKNIPKDALEKVQVYQERLPNSDDSLMKMNLLLKKNSGLFGKLGMGAGTDERYEADGNLNFFNKRSQLSVVSAFNNVNKIANSAAQLLEHGAYKMSGASIDYQPDFNMGGIDRPFLAGLTFRHNFGESRNYTDNNELSSDYLIDNVKRVENRDTRTLMFLGNDSSQNQHSTTNLSQDRTGNKLSLYYDKRDAMKSFFASVYGITGRINQNSTSLDQTFFNDTTQLISSSLKQEVGVTQTNYIMFQTGYRQLMSSTGMQKFDLNYELVLSDRHADTKTINQFSSVKDPSQNRLFNRGYLRSGSNISQQLTATYGDLLQVLKDRPVFLSGFSLRLKNELGLTKDDGSNRVEDLLSSTGQPVLNANLTNNIQTRIVNEQPALALAKKFKKELPDRYSKELTIEFESKFQFYDHNVRSDQNFQNFARSYSKFQPTFSVKSGKMIAGKYYNNLSISLRKFSEFPTTEQLVGLVDSVDQNFILFSNRRLQEEDHKEFTVQFSHQTMSGTKGIAYDLTVSAGQTDNSFSDSSVVDAIGRRLSYTVNRDGYLYLKLNGRAEKAFSVGRNQLQLVGSMSADLNRDPSYINNADRWSDNLSGNARVFAYYRFRNLLTLRAETTLDLQSSRQSVGMENTFNNSTLTNLFVIGAQPTRKIFFKSSLAYNRVKSTGVAPYSFALWHMEGGYRFLKADNLELKLSAWDLLRQNKGVINYSDNLSLKRGVSNVLRQYFMLSVSFYPRKFGRGDD